jgi:hypothetical protein
MFWIMICKGGCRFKYIEAGPPCNKGEINIPIIKWRIVIGWQREGGQDDSRRTG